MLRCINLANFLEGFFASPLPHYLYFVKIFCNFVTESSKEYKKVKNR